ncbi:MAG: sensor histidine kinase [Bacteroidales bacterium]
MSGSRKSKKTGEDKTGLPLIEEIVGFVHAARYPVFAIKDENILYRNTEALRWNELADKVVKLGKSRVPHSGQMLEAEGALWRVLEWVEVEQVHWLMCVNASEQENQAWNAEKLIRQLAHEFRTPLNSMLGFTELMLEETDDEAQREYLVAILRAGESLVSMLTQVLDYGRIATGKFVEEAVPVEMENFAELLRFFFLPQARRSNLDFRVVLDEKIPPLLVFDAGRVRQILFNLISNALKYTVQGGVKVELRVDKEKVDTVEFCWIITDTGSGIPSDFTNKRVEEYDRGRKDMALTSSAGLGLSIALGMARALGGELIFQAGEEGGTKAIFTMTAKKYTEGDEALPIGYQGLKGFKILVADELGPSRERIREWIEWAGGEPIAMSSLAEASSYANRNSVDALVVVLNSLQLVSFRELLLQLRSYPLAEIKPLIGVLPFGENRSEILNVFDFIFYQPLKARDFIEKLSEWLSPEGTPGRWDETMLRVALAEVTTLALEELRSLILKLASPIPGFHDPAKDKLLVDKLLNWAVKNNLKSFINFGKTLLRLLNNFEIDTFESLLSMLQQIINSLLSNNTAHE